MRLCTDFSFFYISTYLFGCRVLEGNRPYIHVLQAVMSCGGNIVCCKLFVGDAFQRSSPFTQLNENDFGFQTVSSRRKTAEGTGGGVNKTSKDGEIQTDPLVVKNKPAHILTHTEILKSLH